MRTAIALALIGVIGFLWSSCGDGNGIIPPAVPPGSGPPSATGPITDEQRLAALRDCSTFVNALGDIKSQAAQDIVVAWLKTRPEFEEAGAEDGNVWAYFRDGRVVLIIPNWLGDTDGSVGGRGAQPHTGRKAEPDASGRVQGIPGSNRVKLYYGLGKAFGDFRTAIKSIFSKSKTEYNVTLEEASIENLTNTNDLGIFYINTHGGSGYVKPRSEKKGLFGLWTTDTTTLVSERTYEAELNSNYLVYMLAVDDDPKITEWHYGISDYFVRTGRYMNFADDVVIFINACNGMSPAANVLRDAMIKKARNQKATYIGWTSTTDETAAEPVTLFVFDRMLGTNQDNSAGNTTIGSESPDQRPFDFSSIFDDIWNFINADPPLGVAKSGGRLAFYSVHDSDIILTPSIEYISMNDHQSTMYIKGSFGRPAKEDQHVTVAGVPASIVFWNDDLISCTIPTVGKGSSGDVVVSVRGNQSNVVPLTEWVIPLELFKNDMGPTLRAQLNIRIRADVHSYRLKPGEQPRRDRPDSLGVWTDQGNIGYPIAIGSDGAYDIGGQRHATCQIKDCTIEQTESVLSQYGKVPYSLDATKRSFAAFYKWSPDMRFLRMQGYVTVPDVGYEFRMRNACPGQPDVNTDQSVGGSMGIQFPATDLAVLTMELDDAYNIKAGFVETSQDVKWGVCQHTEKARAYAKWPTVTPIGPPTDKTQARVGGD